MRRFAHLAVLALLAGVGLVGCSREPGPEQALRAFLDGWHSGDLGAVTLEDPNGRVLAAADVTKQIETLSGDLVATKATLDPAGDPQSFAFTATWGAFSLSDGQSSSSGDLAPGPYSVAETVPRTVPSAAFS